MANLNLTPKEKAARDGGERGGGMNIYSAAIVAINGPRRAFGSRLVRAETESGALAILERYYGKLGLVIIEHHIVDVTEDVYKWVKDIDAEEWILPEL